MLLLSRRLHQLNRKNHLANKTLTVASAAREHFMGQISRITVSILFGVCAVILIACPGAIEKNEPGPGGLPKGIVEEGTPPETEEDFPIYPGAVKRASGVYDSRDPIFTVREYYVELLGMEPVILDERGEALTFKTDQYTLVLLPMSSASGGGTEISFQSKDPAE